MTRSLVRVLSGIVLFAAACTSETTEPPAKPTPRLQITGDTGLIVGASLALQSALLDSAASGVVPFQIDWRTSDATVAAVRTATCCSGPSALVTGRNAGTAYIYAFVGTLVDSIRITITDTRPIVPIALGQTVSVTVVNGVGTQRYAMQLGASDTIDVQLKVTDAGSGSSLILEQTKEGPRLSPGVRAGFSFERTMFPISGAHAPTSAGTYLFAAYGSGGFSKGEYIAANGTFNFTARRSGPIFAIAASVKEQLPLQVRMGATGNDTIWVQNVGTGVLKLGVSAAGLYRPERDTILVAPSRPTTLGEAPAAGSVPVVVRFDATTASPGSYGTNVQFALPANSWILPASIATPSLSALVYDARIEVVTRRTLNSITSGPLGELYASAGSELFRLDATTGATTRELQVNGTIMDATVAPDGTVYALVTNAATAAVVKYVRGQEPVRFEIVSTGLGASAIAAAADGTIYFFRGGALVHMTSSGTQTVIATPGSAASMAYDAGENALYYIRANVLRRFDIGTGSESARGSLPPLGLPDHVNAIDRGRLYITRENSTRMFIYDTSGNFLEHVVTPESTLDLAVSGGRVYGVGVYGQSGTGTVWSMAIP